MSLNRFQRGILIGLAVFPIISGTYLLSMGPTLLCLDWRNDEPDVCDRIYLHMYSPIVWGYWRSPRHVQRLMEAYVGLWIPHDDPEQIFRWVALMGPL